MNIDQIAMCYISMYSSRQALQANEKLFSNFEFVFEFLAEKKNQTNSEAIAGLRFYPKYLMLYINGFDSTSSTN